MITDILRKPGLIHKLLFMAVTLALSAMSVIAANRYSVASGNWGNTNIWSATPGGPPGATVPGKQDDVFIQNSHIVTATGDIECSSITFTGAIAMLVIDSPGSITLKNTIALNKLADANSECILAGTGTLICVRVNVGSDTNPPPTDGSSSVYTHTFTSRIASLNLSVKGAPKNDLTINSYSGLASNVRNGIFNLENGTVTIDGQVITNNAMQQIHPLSQWQQESSQVHLSLKAGHHLSFFPATGTNDINLFGTASLVNYAMRVPRQHLEHHIIT